MLRRLQAAKRMQQLWETVRWTRCGNELAFDFLRKARQYLWGSAAESSVANTPVHTTSTPPAHDASSRHLSSSAGRLHAATTESLETATRQYDVPGACCFRFRFLLHCIVIAPFDVPGMVVLLKRKSIEAPIQAAFGVRKKGNDHLLTTADTFHIGSTTKAFTSTLLALLVSVMSLRQAFWSSTDTRLRVM